MKIGIPKERHPKENRVAGSPYTVKKLVDMGVEVLVEKEAGHDSMMLDQEYQEVGAEICPDATSVFSEADIIVKVQRPLTIPEIGLDETALLPPEQVLIGKLDALINRDQVKAYAESRVTTFASGLITLAAASQMAMPAGLQPISPRPSSSLRTC